jgi:flagellar assembly factor FliW
MSKKVSSSLFGEIEYSQDEVYSFANGIPGFPGEKAFVFREIEESPFTAMHSTGKDLYFLLINPFLFFPDYEFTIPDYMLEQLSIERQEQVACYSVVVLREPLHESTVNLVAPIIVNKQNRRGAQLVLENTTYSVRQPIFVNEEQKIDETAAAVPDQG